MARRPWTPLAALAAIAALALAGCSSDEPAKPKQDAVDAGTYVGHVDGTSANIGLVVKDNRVAAFMCTERNEWLTFPAVDVKGKKATLRADDGTEPGPGTEVDVTFSGDGATGKLDLGDIALFTAEKATGDAGVFRVPAEKEGDPWKGWVVLNDGSYTGNAKGKPTSGSPWIDPDSQP
jgi:hypothetical protein